MIVGGIPQLHRHAHGAIGRGLEEKLPERLSREVRGGGRVVKNVAGYDLMKLHIGALGTLGVITGAVLPVDGGLGMRGHGPILPGVR